MARYIDADALIERLKFKRDETDISGKKYSGLECAIAQVQKAPTADVVPKSEVEKIIGKFECFLCHATGGRLSKHTYDLRTMETVATDCINETYNDGYGEGYKDCAREIFEEIERGIAELYPILYAPTLNKFIAELKKKYTEGEE